MAYIVTNEGESWILSGAFCMSGGSANALDLTASLITSALTFTATMTYSSITNVTAGGSGVASARVAASAWCIPFNSAGSATISARGATAAAGYQWTFTAAPNSTAVGYAIWSSGKLILVETFSDGPYSLTNAGDTVTVTPYIKLGSGSGN